MTASEKEKFQREVHRWALTCLPVEAVRDPIERSYRFLEEALETVQAAGVTEDDAKRLVEYVYARPQGDVTKEAGGALVTLSALCTAFDVWLWQCGERELARCWRNLSQIRAKHQAKRNHRSEKDTRPVARGGEMTSVQLRLALIAALDEAIAALERKIGFNPPLVELEKIRAEKQRFERAMDTLYHTRLLVADDLGDET